MSSSIPCFVGIDVAKDSLEIALRPAGEQFSIANHPREFPALVTKLKPLAIERIVVEATGGLELLLVTSLAAAALPVVVVNPRQARHFAQATNQLTKTDAVDARVLAHMGELLKPKLRPLPTSEQQEFEARLTR